MQYHFVVYLPLMSLTWGCLTLPTFIKPYPEPSTHEQASLPGFIPSL